MSAVAPRNQDGLIGYWRGSAGVTITVLTHEEQIHNSPSVSSHSSLFTLLSSVVASSHKDIRIQPQKIGAIKQKHLPHTYRACDPNVCKVHRSAGFIGYPNGRREEQIREPSSFSYWHMKCRWQAWKSVFNMQYIGFNECNVIIRKRLQFKTNV